MKVTCKCGAVYNLGPKFAGRKVKCKKCSAAIQVPGEPVAGGKRKPSVTPVVKTAADRKREKEDALLAKFEAESKGKTSTMDFIENNFKDAFEERRLNWAMASIGSGILFILAGLAVGWYMWQLEDGELTLAVIAYLSYLGGQFWFPPLLMGIGVWRIIAGISEIGHVRHIRNQRKKKKSK